MQKVNVIEFDGQRVLTSKQIAECYGTTADIIGYNFRYNKERYIIGKHYIMLEGQVLKAFKFTNVEIQRSLPKISKLYLWTEKGALLHAKSLNTDKAWEVYDYLVDFYFHAKEEPEQIKKEVVPEPVKPTVEKNQLIPKMDKPIFILKTLLKVAEEKGIQVEAFPFEGLKSALNGNHIGIKTKLLLEEVNYELAFELARAFIHFDGGNMIESPLRKDYNGQAERAATMIIQILNMKIA